jgi:phage terminase large subunit-like protein
MTWDKAMKGGPANDWSVCTAWAQTRDGRMSLLDVLCRCDTAQILRLVTSWFRSVPELDEFQGVDRRASLSLRPL